MLYITNGPIIMSSFRDCRQWCRAAAVSHGASPYLQRWRDEEDAHAVIDRLAHISAPLIDRSVARNPGGHWFGRGAVVKPQRAMSATKREPDLYASRFGSTGRTGATIRRSLYVCRVAGSRRKFVTPRPPRSEGPHRVRGASQPRARRRSRSVPTSEG